MMHQSPGTAPGRPKGESRPTATLWRQGLFLALAALLGIPLYLLMVVVIIRAGLLDPSGPPFNDEQLKALLAFLGVALTATASAVGLILSKASSDRAFAQQVADSDRQTLETAVRVLDLLKVDQGHADPIIAAGALTTLVYLRHPIIAMQILRVAFELKAVGIKSAVWLIDRILSEPATPENEPLLAASKQNAAELLQKHVADLTADAEPGMAEWPNCAFGSWPTGLSIQCSLTLSQGLRELLVSRSASWWETAGRTWSWAIYSLVCVAEMSDTDVDLANEAAGYGLRMLTALRDGDDVETLTGTVPRGDVDARLRKALDGRVDEALDAAMRDKDMERWITEARELHERLDGGLTTSSGNVPSVAG
jgi:hypothetical protein